MPRKIETLLGQTFSVDSEGLITTSSGGTANFVPDLIDISASNGIIHVIDAVLVPSDASSDEDDEDNGRRPGEQSIAEIAIAAEDEFDELVAALTYVDDELDAGLVDLFLNGTDQFTVFAPTDDAFLALYEALGDEVSEITDIDPEDVLNVLLYHVTEGRRGSNSVVPPKMPRKIETLLGQTFSVDSEGLITTASGGTANFVPDLIDISASNGIIHVIDAVLVPEL
jgi:transforming growth factor-beta-induced protein